MRVYVDWPWSFDVRRYGAPVRAYVHTKKWEYIIGAKAQRWDPVYGYTREWSSFVRHPTREYTCGAVLEDHVTCPLLKKHLGRHWNWHRGWKQTNACQADPVQARG